MSADPSAPLTPEHLLTDDGLCSVELDLKESINLEDRLEALLRLEHDPIDFEARR